MAHVFKDARSPYFFASWTAFDGRRVKRSTKQDMKSKALEIAHRMELEEKDARFRFVDESARRYLVEDLKIRMLGRENCAPNCKKWFEQWLEGKKLTLGHTTYLRYEFCLKNFQKLRFCHIELKFHTCATCVFLVGLLSPSSFYLNGLGKASKNVIRGRFFKNLTLEYYNITVPICCLHEI